jgi:hypothetical protein
MRTGRPGNKFDPLQRQEDFPLEALGPIQYTIQWVQGVISPGVKGGQGVTPDVHEFGLKSQLWHQISNKYTTFKPSSSRNQMRTTQHQPDQQVTMWYLSVCNSINLVIHRTIHTSLLHLHLISVLADTSDNDETCLHVIVRIA